MNLPKENPQLNFLKTEAMACSVYLEIARTTRDESRYQRVLDSAFLAYSALNTFLPITRLTQEQRKSLEENVRRLGKELQDLFVRPSSSIPLPLQGFSQLSILTPNLELSPARPPEP